MMMSALPCHAMRGRGPIPHLALRRLPQLPQLLSPRRPQVIPQAHGTERNFVLRVVVVQQRIAKDLLHIPRCLQRSGVIVVEGDAHGDRGQVLP